MVSKINWETTLYAILCSGILGLILFCRPLSSVPARLFSSIMFWVIPTLNQRNEKKVAELCVENENLGEVLCLGLGQYTLRYWIASYSNWIIAYDDIYMTVSAP